MLSAASILVLSLLSASPLDRLTLPGTKAVVLFFVASDCPVSNRTFPEMKRLRETYTARGIRFLFVYPNRDEKRSEVRTHQHAFDPGGETLLDPEATLVRLTHAAVTPEAAILVRNSAARWKPVYVGRIDDRFVHIGQERTVVTRHLAEAAIRNLLEDKPIVPDDGTAVGCTILTKAVR